MEYLSKAITTRPGLGLGATYTQRYAPFYNHNRIPF